MIPAVDISIGTVPAGSTWRRNPIPACRAPNGGAFGESCGQYNGTHPDDYQFPPAGSDPTRPGQLLGGFGAGGCCELTRVMLPSFWHACIALQVSSSAANDAADAADAAAVVPD